MSKNLEEARELLDKMSSNHYQWQTTRGPTKEIAGVHELDALSTIQAQLAIITKKLGRATVSSIQTNSSCDFCGWPAIILPSSKMNKLITSTTIKGRTTPTPTRTIQVEESPKL